MGAHKLRVALVAAAAAAVVVAGGAGGDDDDDDAGAVLAGQADAFVEVSLRACQRTIYSSELSRLTRMAFRSSSSPES